MKLCAFADEASSMLDGQISALKRNDIPYLEIRGIDGKNIKDVTVPEALVGDVMGDLNKRRGAVLGMDAADKDGYTVVHAIAPKAEIADYPISLRAMTQGRGSFEYQVTGYDTVPANVASKVIAEYKAQE